MFKGRSGWEMRKPSRAVRARAGNRASRLRSVPSLTHVNHRGALVELDQLVTVLPDRPRINGRDAARRPARTRRRRSRCRCTTRTCASTPQPAHARSDLQPSRSRRSSHTSPAQPRDVCSRGWRRRRELAGRRRRRVEVFFQGEWGAVVRVQAELKGEERKQKAKQLVVFRSVWMRSIEVRLGARGEGCSGWPRLDLNRSKSSAGWTRKARHE